MIPAPHAPDVWTISHVLEVVKRTIMEFDLPGQVLATHQHPGGTAVAARIIPLLADLQAIRKVAGFLSHAATAFCSFCKCPHTEIEDLDYHNWESRDGIEVRQQAWQWKNLLTVTAKEKLSCETGVRWTPMHDLPYWNPVQHVVLGFMHNFLEGVLQYQLRVLWGVGRTKAALKVLTNKMDKQDTVSITSGRTADSEDEDEVRQAVVGLTSDFMEVDDVGSTTLDGSDTDSDTPTPAIIPQRIHSDDESDGELSANIPTTAFDFTPAQLASLRACIRDTLLPTWVQRPPANLGEASHGKLKAHELLLLFAVFFPLVVPELWYYGEEHSQLLLESFCHLVSSTNIIASYSVTSSEADIYTYHYIKYRQSIQQLFPEFPSVPNHHYAMHNGDLFKFWGPLSILSEFPGERMNGDLGQIKTNRHLGMLILFIKNFIHILNRLHGVDHAPANKS